MPLLSYGKTLYCLCTETEAQRTKNKFTRSLHSTLVAKHVIISWIGIDNYKSILNSLQLSVHFFNYIVQNIINMIKYLKIMKRSEPWCLLALVDLCHPCPLSLNMYNCLHRGHSFMFISQLYLHLTLAECTLQSPFSLRCWPWTWLTDSLVLHWLETSCSVVSFTWRQIWLLSWPFWDGCFHVSSLYTTSWSDQSWHKNLIAVS